MIDKNGKNVNLKDAMIYWGSLLLIIFSLIVTTTSFSSQLQKIVLNREIWQAEKVAYYISKITRQEIERCEDVLASSRIFFEEEDFTDDDKLILKLKDIKNEENDLYRVGYMDNNKRIVYDNDTYEFVTDDNLINKIYDHKNYVTNYFVSSDIDSNSIQVAVPVYHNGEVIGALVGHYRILGISNVLGYNEDSLRYFQIIDASGNYVSKNNSKYSFANGVNMWKELERYHLLDGVTIDQIKDNIQMGLSGTFHFTYENQGRYVSYEPLGINDWYIYSVIVEEGLSQYTDKISNQFEKYLVGLSVLILLLVIIIALSDKKKRSIIKQQNEELIVKNKLYNMIIYKSKDTPFEIDINAKTMTLLYSEQLGKKIDRQVWEDFSPESLLECGDLSPESFDDCKKMYDAIFSNKEIPNTILKVRIKDEWRFVRVNMLHATQNNLVGFFEDYDTEMRQLKMIEEVNKQVMIDELTGLYRRDSFIKLLAERNASVSEEKLGVMILIDLDGFKDVNDKLGHSLGDRALGEAAVSLKKVLRKNDLIGRLGGDEFLVYLEGVNNLDGVRVCASKINEALTKVYEKDGKYVLITASMGIVIYNRDTPFEVLYERADEQLYKVKLSSKNSYRIVEI